jgi:ketosteroid isomerase-like protein
MEKYTAYTLTLICTLVSCQQQTVDKQAEAEKLMQTSREWSKSTTSTDAARIVSYWADDAILISPGEPPLQGKNALIEMVEATSKDSTFSISWEPVTAEISESGDMGYLIEDSQMTMADSTGKSVTKHYKSVTIWRKQKDGSWKNVVDIMSPK